jgi:hypothetical protein
VDLFRTDFREVSKLTDDATLYRKDGTKLTFKRQLYLDFPAKTKFVGLYIPSTGFPPSALSFKASLDLAEEVRHVLDDMPRKVVVNSGTRDQMNSIQDLTFSGRVLLYHEDFFSIPQKAKLINAYKARNYDVQFRGPDYLGDQVVAWYHEHDKKETH